MKLDSRTAPERPSHSIAPGEDADPQRVLNLRPGELVKVRSAKEVFKTLDERGMLENLPFMPEMHEYCGRVLSVDKRADKTCTDRSMGMRRMSDVVHLSSVRCDGAAHGGCQAACLMYWKEAWLTRHGRGDTKAATDITESTAATEREEASFRETLLAATQDGGVPSGNPAWRCQATEIPRASVRLYGWQLSQYRRDIRNWGILTLLRCYIVESFNRLQELSRRYLPRRLLFKDGRTVPFLAGTLEKSRTPSEELGLQPGDWVRVKPKEEIVKTLDRTNKNRGLSFDPEMVKYCGRTARVRGRVERLIDEETGRMIHIKTDCILLEGMICDADYHRLCTRGIYQFWREVWLERMPSAPSPDPSRPSPP